MEMMEFFVDWFGDACCALQLIFYHQIGLSLAGLTLNSCLNVAEYYYPIRYVLTTPDDDTCYCNSPIMTINDPTVGNGANSNSY